LGSQVLYFLNFVTYVACPPGLNIEGGECVKCPDGQVYKDIWTCVDCPSGQVEVDGFCKGT
jgi:hypothetical protein